MSARAMEFHKVPPALELLYSDATQADLVGAIVSGLHVAVAQGEPVDPITLALMCAGLWNRQPEEVRRG